MIPQRAGCIILNWLEVVNKDKWDKPISFIKDHIFYRL